MQDILTVITGIVIFSIVVELTKTGERTDPFTATLNSIKSVWNFTNKNFFPFVKEKTEDLNDIVFKRTKAEEEFHSNIYMSREDKKEHLRSLYWQQLKERKLIQQDYRCAKCGKSTIHLDLHHITYERLGFERDDDVILLCRACHSSLHEKKGYDRNTRYTLN